MRVLVVAGTGFIGGHVAQAFVESGHAVATLVRSRARAARDARLSGVDLLEGSAGAIPVAALDGPFDVVAYAAGAWLRDERASAEEVARRCDEVYVQGVRTLAERAAAWRAHFVFVSGISRYGDVDWTEPLREDRPPGPLSIYGAHKRKSEAILAATAGMRWTALVPHEVYGAHDVGGYVRFVFQRVRARRFVLLGDGENRWSICNVRNVASAAVHVASREGLGAVHVADARPSSQREIASAIARALGRRPLFPRVPRSIALAAAAINARVPRPWPAFAPSHVRVRTTTMLLDTSRLDASGFAPEATLDEGIDAAVAWWLGEGRATVSR